MNFKTKSHSVDSKKKSYWPIFEPKCQSSLNESFWNKRNIRISSNIVFNKGILFKKNSKSHKEVKEYLFILYENGLLIYSEQENQDIIKGWIQLGTKYFVKLVSYSLNQKVIRLKKYKNFNLFLWAINYESTFQWFKIFQQYCISENFEFCYTKVCQIGQGGFSKVYKVAPLLKQTFQKSEYYCAKVYNIKDLQQKKGNLKIIKKFIKKECSLLKIINSPYIIKLFEIIQLEDVLILILEYIQGGTLHQYLQYNGGQIQQLEALQIILQIAYGLYDIHNTNHVHRDLKLDNIMLESNNPLILKIIDFGLSESIDRNRLNSGQGTAGYLAPEIFKFHPYEEEADIFSLGVIMYTILTGQSPFSAQNHQELLRKNQECKINFSSVYLCDSFTISILKRTLEYEPQNRISLIQLIFQLEQKTNTQKLLQKSKQSYELNQNTVSYDNPFETKVSEQDTESPLNKQSIISDERTNYFLKNNLKLPQSQRSLNRFQINNIKNPFVNSYQTQFEKTVLGLKDKEENCQSNDDEFPIEQLNIGQLRISTYLFNSKINKL